MEIILHREDSISSAIVQFKRAETKNSLMKGCPMGIGRFFWEVLGVWDVCGMVDLVWDVIGIKSFQRVGRKAFRLDSNFLGIDKLREVPSKLYAKLA
jgi:hypothetical protein